MLMDSSQLELHEKNGTKRLGVVMIVTATQFERLH